MPNFRARRGEIGKTSVIFFSKFIFFSFGKELANFWKLWGADFLYFCNCLVNFWRIFAMFGDFFGKSMEIQEQIWKKTRILDKIQKIDKIQEKSRKIQENP